MTYPSLKIHGDNISEGILGNPDLAVDGALVVLIL